MKDQLRGTIANLPMVFTDQDQMDEDALRQNINSYLEKMRVQSDLSVGDEWGVVQRVPG